MWTFNRVTDRHRRSLTGSPSRITHKGLMKWSEKRHAGPWSWPHSAMRECKSAALHTSRRHCNPSHSRTCFGAVSANDHIGGPDGRQASTEGREVRRKPSLTVRGSIPSRPTPTNASARRAAHRTVLPPINPADARFRSRRAGRKDETSAFPRASEPVGRFVD